MQHDAPWTIRQVVCASSSVDFSSAAKQGRSPIPWKTKLSKPSTFQLFKKKIKPWVFWSGFFWLSKPINKIQHKIVHWPTVLCCCRLRCYPATQGKSSSAALIWRGWHELSTQLGSIAALPNPRRSQLHHLNYTKCWFCLVYPEASILLRVGWWGCNILQLLYYGMSLLYIPPT